MSTTSGFSFQGDLCVPIKKQSWIIFTFLTAVNDFINVEKNTSAFIASLHKAGDYILSLLKNCGSGVFSSYILQHLLTIKGKACFPVLGEIQQHILTEFSKKNV